ncbi:MAG: glucosaminidase domain-containing protein [Pseudomonadota bacterium]
MSAHVNEFSRRVYIAARNFGLQDPQARLAAAQASLETLYGQSVKGNNYFGIKARSSWKGDVQRFQTWEEIDGKRVIMTDRFRKYDSIDDSLADWVETVSTRFPDAMSAQSFTEAVEGLQNGIFGEYASDSRYGQKLAYIERRIGEQYSPPSDTLLRFKEDSEKNAQLQDILSGNQKPTGTPSIFDTHRMGLLNVEATPVPPRKPSHRSHPNEVIGSVEDDGGHDARPARAEPEFGGAQNHTGEDAMPIRARPRPKPERVVPARKPGSLQKRGRSDKSGNLNPFDLDKPDLNPQAQLIQENPVRARQLILEAGRDPKMFRL